MQWRDGLEAADTLFEQLLPVSPDQKRAISEWKLVRHGLGNVSILKQFLASADALVHSELPFAWSNGPKAVVEGLIDLLIIEPAERRCLLVDWKTNRIGKGEEEQLRQRYRPQLAAYWKAVGEITGYEVNAGLFATATGTFTSYESAELETEWQRLSALPPDQVVEEVSAL
jgi:ATP-dependent exoDNAse (exonuclease V) beta subunit